MTQGTLEGLARPEVPYVLPTMAQIRAIKPNGLTAVSTFSGCGGSSLGMRMAGWRVPYAVEFIPAAADTYEANSPTAIVDRRDIREVDGAEILAAIGLERGDLDLFEGSPPCSSFSAAGMRERGWGKIKRYSDSSQRTDDLFDHWVRLLLELKPRAFIAENVPGMVNGSAAEYAHAVTLTLSKEGYRVGAKILDASLYGVAQKRERLIFVGYRNDQGIEPSFPSPVDRERPTLAEALRLAGPPPADELAYADMRPFAVGRTWEAMKGIRDGEKCQNCGEYIGVHRREERIIEDEAEKDRLLASDGEGRRKEKFFCADGSEAVVIKDYFMLQIPDLGEPCPTVTATASQTGAASVTHPTECRKFTPTELRAISGFPRDFILTGDLGQQCERIGRAVMPPLYAAVTGTIANRLKETT